MIPPPKIIEALDDANRTLSKILIYLKRRKATKERFMGNIGKRCAFRQVMKFGPEEKILTVWSPGKVVDEDYTGITVEYYSPMPPDKKIRKFERQDVTIFPD